MAALAGRLAPTVSQLRPLAGGASSLTYTGERAGQKVVVKVAPPGLEPIAHRDVLRQSRIMRALAPTPVPVPQVLLEDQGDPPSVPPLFVMAHVPGTSLEPLFDTHAEDTGTVVAERFRRSATILAQLHGITPETVRLGSEPVVGPAAEIERWCRTLKTVDAALVPNWFDVADVLRSSIPAGLPPAIVHGDFRLGNLLAVGKRITAVIDWEIWSVGDPRVDVGWFLINCDPNTYRRASPYCGVTPSASELAAIYGAVLRQDVPDLDWFKALACFKSAATWSLIVKHNRRRSTPAPGIEAMAPVLPDLLAQARCWLA